MTDDEQRPWTFLTNHARVLMTISQNPDIRARDVAATIGITERSTQRIVAELEEAGYLTRERVGRRNHYKVTTTASLRHPHEQGVEIGLLLDLFSNATDPPSANSVPRRR
ncbi:MAG: MarR family winged helix-turn-helix transcriptional regulator [Acidimicrobiia bacterium]|nr:MarR family winged helix-turn-helix transcriptional regulator [Acidimicrobiia bacterium]